MIASQIILSNIDYLIPALPNCILELSSRFLLEQLHQMVNEGMYNLFFEDALVQMIFDNNFELYYLDIKDYQWTEVDTVDDLLKAKEINV